MEEQRNVGVEVDANDLTDFRDQPRLSDHLNSQQPSTVKLL